MSLASLSCRRGSDYSTKLQTKSLGDWKWFVGLENAAINPTAPHNLTCFIFTYTSPVSALRRVRWVPFASMCPNFGDPQHQHSNGHTFFLFTFVFTTPTFGPQPNRPCCHTKCHCAGWAAPLDLALQPGSPHLVILVIAGCNLVDKKKAPAYRIPVDISGFLIWEKTMEHIGTHRVTQKNGAALGRLAIERLSTEAAHKQHLMLCQQFWCRSTISKNPDVNIGRCWQMLADVGRCWPFCVPSSFHFTTVAREAYLVTLTTTLSSRRISLQEWHQKNQKFKFQASAVLRTFLQARFWWYLDDSCFFFLDVCWMVFGCLLDDNNYHWFKWLQVQSHPHQAMTMTWKPRSLRCQLGPHALHNDPSGTQSSCQSLSIGIHWFPMFTLVLCFLTSNSQVSFGVLSRSNFLK